jgi:hypothetical protein
MLRSLLLFASRYTSHLVVLLLGCQAFEDEDLLDQRERHIRLSLSMAGFDGDAAPILRCPEARLSASGRARLLELLDSAIPPAVPTHEVLPLPEEHNDLKLASMLSSLKRLVRIKSELTLSPTNVEELFAREIGSQFGGMPYQENTELWPNCQRCPGRPLLHFLWQLDARVLRPAVKGAGLFVCYVCEEAQHPRGTDDLLILHYPEPKRELRRKPCAEARTSFQRTGRPITPSSVSYSLELELPHPVDLRAADRYYDFSWKVLEALYPGRNAEDAYRELREILGVTEADYDKDAPGPMQLGGYSAPPESLRTPNCPQCKKLMRTLANVHYSYELWLPWNFKRFQFFLCACKPGEARLASPKTNE